MAIMSRKKQAVARRWEIIDSQRDKENEPIKEKEEKLLSDDEHKKRLEVLKELGLLK
jgi:hypothetical protein